jgi:hypothetical protein
VSERSVFVRAHRMALLLRAVAQTAAGKLALIDLR